MIPPIPTPRARWSPRERFDPTDRSTCRWLVSDGTSYLSETETRIRRNEATGTVGARLPFSIGAPGPPVAKRDPFSRTTAKRNDEKVRVHKCPARVTSTASRGRRPRVRELAMESLSPCMRRLLGGGGPIRSDLYRGWVSFKSNRSREHRYHRYLPPLAHRSILKLKNETRT